VWLLFINDNRRILWLAYSTDNYQDLADVWKSSLLQITSVKDIRHKIDNISGNYDESGFQTQLFRDACVNTINFLISELSNVKNYNYIVLTECDIQYFKNDWSDLFKFIEEDGKSIYFMRENGNEEINSGWYILKSSYADTFKKFLEKMIKFGDIRNDKLPIQDYYNNHKNELDYGYIPDKYIIWGGNLTDKNSSTVLLHHSVAVGANSRGRRGNVDNKLEQMKDVKSKLQQM
jgi:hypothetical protein